MNDATLAPPGLSDAFSHGFLITGGRAAVPSIARSWPSVSVGTATVHLHPKTRHRGRVVPAGQVLLIGHPVDLDLDSIDIDRISERAAQALSGGGIEAFTRYVAYLGGRFTALALQAGSLWVVPDACATQSTYWSAARGGAIASHVELVAAAVGADVDEDAMRRLANLRTIRPGFTHYFAGIETAYVGVRPLLANCRLRWEIGANTFRHERFYPFDEIAVRSVDSAYADFREVHTAGCRLLASFGRVGISLTAGGDSRTTLAGVAPFLRDDSFSFTYFNPASSSVAAAEDVFEANRTAFDMGLAHRVLRWRRPAPDSAFERAFGTTWKAHRPSDGAACAMYEDLPRDFFQLQSMHAEVGTTFYKRRTDEPPTAKRLTSLYQTSKAAEIAEYVEQFEAFIEYADFRPENFAGRDYHDMFYWEHRDSRWAAQKPHEGDLGHRVLQPFSSRRLIEIMHSVPYEHRRDKTLLRRRIEDRSADSGRRPGGRLLARLWRG